MATQRLTFFTRVQRPGDGNDWLRWLSDPGTNNLQDPFGAGVPSVRPYAFVDLSAHASYALGRQVAQSATYKLRGITIGYRMHQGVGVENESETAFQGRLTWFGNTKHFREAMSLANKVENANEADQVDADSLFLSTQKDYSAMRMGWIGAGDIAYQTSENIAGINAGAWNLTEVAAVYNAMTAPDEANALFNGRFPGTQEIGWNAAVSSGGAISAGAASDGGRNHLGGWQDYERTNMNHDVARGLMVCDVTHSTVADYHGNVEDDYEWWVGIDYTVEVDA